MNRNVRDRAIEETGMIAVLVKKGYEVYVPASKDTRFAYLVRKEGKTEFEPIEAATEANSVNDETLENLTRYVKSLNLDVHGTTFSSTAKSKAATLIIIRKFLVAGWDAYLPAIDTGGVSCVLGCETGGHASFLDVRIRQRDGKHPWIDVVRPRANYWYVLTSLEQEDNPFWAIPTLDLKAMGIPQIEKGKVKEGVWKVKMMTDDEEISVEFEKYKGLSYLDKWRRGEIDG